MTSSTPGTPRATTPARGAAPCPGPCNGTRQASQYLCRTCWYQLPPRVRAALWHRDNNALARLRELHQQLDKGVPIAEITVTP